MQLSQNFLVHAESNLGSRNKVSNYNIETSEGLHYAAALVVHTRTRFIVNLLPLLEKATALRRVVSVFAATYEGPIDMNDFQGWKLPLLQQRGHAASVVTLSLEFLAKKAPSVSFIHDFPGPVKSGIARGTKGLVFFIFKAFEKVLGPMVFIPTVESGDFHLFLATSAKYPAGANEDTASGVPLAGVAVIGRGTDGKAGSGTYSVDQHGESAGAKAEKLLANFRKEGMVEKAWENIKGEFVRITGLEAA